MQNKAATETELNVVQVLNLIYSTEAWLHWQMKKAWNTKNSDIYLATLSTI